MSARTDRAAKRLATAKTQLGSATGVANDSPESFILLALDNLSAAVNELIAEVDRLDRRLKKRG